MSRAGREEMVDNGDNFGFEDRILHVMYYVPVLLVKTLDIVDKVKELTKIYMGELFVYADNRDEFNSIEQNVLDDELLRILDQKYLSNGYNVYEDDTITYYSVSLDSTKFPDISIVNGELITSRQYPILYGPLNNHIGMFRVGNDIVTVGFQKIPSKNEIDFVSAHNQQYLGNGKTSNYICDQQFIELRNGMYFLFTRSND